MAQPTKMIVGLGNPGADYLFNRHNVGFMAADALAHAWRANAWQSKFKAQIASVQVAGETALLVKPTTYMNLSGEAVGEALRYYKLSAPDVIVIHDDIDLLPAQIRIKQGGGNGGHNGLKSLDATIGKEYWRVRIGVGRPEHKGQVSDYVLGNFSKTDRIWLEHLVAAMPDGIEAMVTGDTAKCLRLLTAV